MKVNWMGGFPTHINSSIDPVAKMESFEISIILLLKKFIKSLQVRAVGIQGSIE